MKPNGLLFLLARVSSDRQVKTMPMLIDLSNPTVATPLATSHYSDLGVDKVAIVHFEKQGLGLNITRISDTALFENGDTTTSKRALDLLISRGEIHAFVAKTCAR